MTPWQKFLRLLRHYEREIVLYERRQKEAKLAVELEKIKTIQVGNLYNLRKMQKNDEEVCLDWVIVRQHPDDQNLYFFVPMDSSSLVGSADVEIPVKALAGPGVVRCGCGIWLSADDVDISQLCGFLEPEYVLQIRHKLSAMVKGELVGELVETDADPDYDEVLQATMAQAQYIEFHIQGIL